MARLIDEVYGHEQEIEKLISMQRNSRWPHAVLFVGPSGVGKKKVALAFTQMLICTNKQSDQVEACGKCPACLRVEKQQSESLIVIEPSSETVKKVIKVEVIRDLLTQLSLANLGSARVVIIDHAQAMNPQASNALLKTLEEPFENVYFILIGDDTHSFLPTIRSRTQVIRFSGLNIEHLKKIKPHLPDWAYRSCRGQLDQLQLLTSTEGIQKRDEALSLFENFCGQPDFLVESEWKAFVKDRAQAQFSLKCWLQIVRDLLVLKTKSTQFILNTDQIERLKKLFEIQTKKLLILSQNILLAERALKGNAEPVLVFENLWVKYARMD